MVSQDVPGSCLAGLGRLIPRHVAPCVSGDSSTVTLRCVVDELVRFRLKVRQYALDTPGAAGEARKRQLQERQPLLEACDTLRQDLVTHGINVKVSDTANPGRAVSQETVRGQTVASHWFLRDPLEADVEAGRGRCVSRKNCKTQPSWVRSWPVRQCYPPLLGIPLPPLPPLPLLCNPSPRIRGCDVYPEPSPSGQRQCSLHMGTAGSKDKTPETWGPRMRWLHPMRCHTLAFCSFVMKTLY